MSCSEKPNGAPKTQRAAVLRPDRVVLVHLMEISKTDPTSFSGRAEHVTSGRCLEFGRTAELMSFFREIILGTAVSESG
jgi:hypothetical protein